MKNLLGIDIGGTKCAVTYGRCEGSTVEIVDKFRFNTTDVEQTLNNLLKTTELVMTHNNLTAENTAAIGISCGGPLDSKQGIILSPPNLPGWDHIEIVKLFQAASVSQQPSRTTRTPVPWPNGHSEPV